MGWDPSPIRFGGGSFFQRNLSNKILFIHYMKGRILAIDFGSKKCGIAATDPLQIIVTPIGTIPTADLHKYLREYIDSENVVKIVIGDPSAYLPFQHKNLQSLAELEKWIQKHYPKIEIAHQDESFTSLEAKEIILRSGAKKKKRRDKNLVDTVSAVLILQKYLRHI